MREADRQRMRSRAANALSGGFGGSGDPVPAIHVDAADALSLLDYVEALEGLYRMHKQTETREMRDVKAERAVLTNQVKALQSDENSWQSGYDKGREMGAKHRSAEVDQLRDEVEALRKDNSSLRGSCKAQGEENKHLTRRAKRLAEALGWFSCLHIGVMKPKWLLSILNKEGMTNG